MLLSLLGMPTLKVLEISATLVPVSVLGDSEVLYFMPQFTRYKREI